MAQSCRICGSDTFNSFAEKNNFHLKRCGICDLVQVSDDLSNIRLEDYYGKDFFDDTYMWLQKNGKGRKKEYEKFHYRMQEIEKLKPQKGNILDIGCSFGFFLEVARKRGWAPTGVEIGEYAAKFAQTSLKLEIHISDLKDAPLPSNHFDVITLWNVLEHLDDPISEFNHVNSLLKEDGMVVFTTGDVDSYLRKIQGLRWRAFIPPIHLANYNLKAVRRLLEQTGFTLLSKTIALPREMLLKKLKVIHILKRLNFSDKMMIFARKNSG